MPKKGLLATIFPCCYKPSASKNSGKEKDKEETKSLVPQEKTQTVKIKDANGQEYEVQIEQENSRINSTPMETNEINLSKEEDDIAQEYQRLESIEMAKINSDHPNPHDCFVYRLQNKFVEMKGISKQFMKKDDIG
mmetsp:Transcript_13146/g.20439  ORF Transcript_13146/g.20439 Transcript_13146/m.20439 type:complete len:136 (-) Transcript_13146:1150-1557(-)